MSASRRTYETRMHRVLQHIERNIARPLELAELARVANFSAFHFHRLFAAWTGERVGDYVRRRRLEMAATRLVTQPACSILEVALSVGFGSSEAFSRSFKLRFAQSPSAWRAGQIKRRLHARKQYQHDSKPDQASERPGLQHGNLLNPSQAPSMNVQLKTLEPVAVAYLRHLGPYGEPIGKFWIREMAPWMKANGLLDRARYGISHDDPSVVQPGQCRYDACVEAPAELVLSGNAQRMVLPGGRYAVLAFEGSPETIGEAWLSLLRDWLPSSGLQLDHRPCMEVYAPDPAGQQKEDAFTCEICIPVTRL